MFSPHLRGGWIGGFVAIAQCVAAWCCVYAKVGVVVDNARSDVLAGAIDHERVCRRVDRRTDCRDLAALKENRAVPDKRSGSGQNVDIANYCRSGGEGNVSAGERIS